MLKLLTVSDWTALLFVSLVSIRLMSLLPVLVRELKDNLTLDSASPVAEMKHGPKISVIIPAKDESSTIEAVALSILDSSYRNIELILVDDRSIDNTFDLMTKISRLDPRVKVVKVERLESGWTGKTHALSQAVELASGELYLFSDADAFFSKDLIQHSVSVFFKNRLDLLSLLPSFWNAGFIEKALYPHMALGISYFYPMSKVNDPNSIDSALASGCFIMVSRESYDLLGGWQSFKSEITEDIAFSKSAKLAGLRVMVMLAGNQLKTRPFSTLHGLTGFWVRTFYGGFDKSLAKSLTLLVNYFSLTLVSGIFLFYASNFLFCETDTITNYLMLAYGLTIVGISGSFSLFLNKYNGKPAYGIYSPIGIFLGAWIAFRVLTNICSGKGVMWRGTRYQ